MLWINLKSDFTVTNMKLTCFIYKSHFPIENAVYRHMSMLVSTHPLITQKYR